MKCIFSNCHNDSRRSSKSHGITFHVFPKNLKKRTLWLDVLDMNSDRLRKHSVICSDHFKDSDFYLTMGGLRKIKEGALPFLEKNTSEEDLKDPAAAKVCRICLAADVRMYHMYEHKLDDMYRNITGHTLNEDDDKLPDKLCWECKHRLVSCNTFRHKALKTRNILMEIVNSNEYISMGHIKSINRVENKLKSNLVQRIYDNSDSDLDIKETQEAVNVKVEVRSNDDDEDYKEIEFDVLDVEMQEKDQLETSIEQSGKPETGVIVKEEKNMRDKRKPEKGIQKKGKGLIKVKSESLDDVLGSDLSEMSMSDGSLSEIEMSEKDESEMDLKCKNLEDLYKYIDNLSDPESNDDVKLSEINTKPKKKRKSIRENKVKLLKKEKKNIGSVKITLKKKKREKLKRPQNGGRKIVHNLDESLFTTTSPSYEEQIAEIEKRKQKSSYKYSQYKCELCFLGFQNKDRLEIHMVRHSDLKGTHECFICKTRMSNKNALRKHLTARHSKKYSCNICNFVTQNKGVALKHEKWHAGAKYQCPHCPSEFEKYTTCMSHMRIKHVSDFVCELCGYTFVSENGIDMHKKLKHKLTTNSVKVQMEGPFCDTCQVKFATHDAYDRHLKLSSKHSTDSERDRSIRNDAGNIITETNGSVARIIERQTYSRRRDPANKRRVTPLSGPIACEQCGVELADLRLYAQHFRHVHPDKNRTMYSGMVAPCMCEHCGKIFQSMTMLRDHVMWYHSDQKNEYRCEKCQKSFSQKTSLATHLKNVHNPVKTMYDCKVCGKQFSFCNNRNRHMLIHTGLKKFKCDTCGKCFTTGGERNAHVKYVHLKQPWPKRVRTNHTRHDNE